MERLRERGTGYEEVVHLSAVTLAVDVQRIDVVLREGDRVRERRVEKDAVPSRRHEEGRDQRALAASGHFQAGSAPIELVDVAAQQVSETGEVLVRRRRERLIHGVARPGDAATFIEQRRGLILDGERE